MPNPPSGLRAGRPPSPCCGSSGIPVSRSSPRPWPPKPCPACRSQARAGRRRLDLEPSRSQLLPGYFLNETLVADVAKHDLKVFAQFAGRRRLGHLDAAPGPDRIGGIDRNPGGVLGRRRPEPNRTRPPRRGFARPSRRPATPRPQSGPFLADTPGILSIPSILSLFHFKPRRRVQDEEAPTSLRNRPRGAGRPDRRATRRPRQSRI